MNQKWFKTKLVNKIINECCRYKSKLNALLQHIQSLKISS